MVWIDAQDHENALDIMKLLSKIPVDVNALKNTKIGNYLHKVSKSPVVAVAARAGELVKQWQAAVSLSTARTAVPTSASVASSAAPVTPASASAVAVSSSVAAVAVPAPAPAPVPAPASSPAAASASSPAAAPVPASASTPTSAGPVTTLLGKTGFPLRNTVQDLIYKALASRVAEVDEQDIAVDPIELVVEVEIGANGGQW